MKNKLQPKSISETNDIPVLIISTARTYGGGERYVERIVNVYKRLGIKVCVAVRTENLYRNLLNKHGSGQIQISKIGGLLGAFLVAFKQRRELALGFSHLNGHRDSTLSPFLRLVGIKSTTYRHTDLFRDRTIKSYIKNILYIFSIQFSCGVVCVSKTVFRQLENIWCLPPKVVVPNWLESEEIYDNIVRNFSKNEISVLIVARLDPLKGHATLFDACKGLDGVKIDVLGDGDSKLVEMYKNQENIIFHGFSNNTNEYYTNADVFVLPTHTEGSPLVVVEAMGHGLPVVLSNIPALSEFIEHNENGLLFPVGDSETLRKLIKTLRDDPSLRKKLGSNARQYVLANRLADTAMEKFRLVFSDFGFIQNHF